MKKNKKGFTLVELLAVIVILAIIMIIATQSVGKTVTRSRTQAFNETMELAVKNAKRILQTDGTLTEKALKDSLGYDKNEYDFQVMPSVDGPGYLILLTSKPNGKFKNVDFNTINENNDWIYKMNVDNEAGKNRISFKIDSTGDIKKIDNSGTDIKIANDTLRNNCTVISDANAYDNKNYNEDNKEKNKGKEISFCNKNIIYKDNNEYVRGKSEDFYVIKEDSSSLHLLAKNNLKVGHGDDKSDNIYNLQALDKYTHSVKFSETNYWHKKNDTTKDEYTNVDKNYQHYYPSYVYDDKASIKKYVDSYISYLNNSFAINVTGRLLNRIDFSSLECSAPSTYSLPKCTGDLKDIVCKGTRGFWTGIAGEEKKLFSVGATLVDGNCMMKLSKYDSETEYSSSVAKDWAGVRPVIEIEKSELQKYLDNH